MKLKVKYFNPKCKIEQTTRGNWIDLRSSINRNYRAGDIFLIPLGVAIQLPANKEANVVPRSSTFKNFGLIQLNHFGVIDETYCGDSDQWFMSVLAMKDGRIEEGDRVCQFRIVDKMEWLDIEEVETLGNEDRGGHGSSGVK